MFFLLITVVIFNPFISHLLELPTIKFSDDILLIFLFILILLNINFLLKLINKNYLLKKIFFYMVVISLIGIVSLLINNEVFMSDRLTIGFLFFMKPFILLISGTIIGYRFFNKKYASKLFIYLNILFTIVIITSLIDLFIPSFWLNIVPGQYANNMLRLRSVFTNAGRTSWMFGVIILYMISYIVTYKHNLKSKTISTFIIPLMLVFEYFTYVKKTLLGLLGSIGYLNFRKKISLLKILLFFIFLFLFLFLFQEQFMRFFTEYAPDKMTDKNSRIMLFLGAYELLKIGWYKTLFGLGFGTWGGYASSIVYSPYYYDLGFNKLWGFIPGASSYTGDNYIAHIIAEIGIIGTLFVWKLYIEIFKLYKYIYNTTTSNKYFSKKFEFFGLFFLLIYIELMFEILGICAVEISTVSYFVFLLSGIYIGLVFKYNRKIKR